ncbi:hypothetical protein Q1695_001428 [Nippostrongylus brasiliensis]|nr:hypothetical protein Q1695_001428 [Nippostrongylus brasiliensis]
MVFGRKIFEKFQMVVMLKSDSSAYCVLTNFVVELRGCAMNSVSILSLQQFLRHLLHNLNRPVFVQSLKRFNLTNQTAIQADLLELFKP